MHEPMRLAWIPLALLALAHPSPCGAEDPLVLPADPEPIMVGTTALWEDSVSYRVMLELEAPGRPPARLEFQQANRTRDRIWLHAPSVTRGGKSPAADLDEIDAADALFGFRPLRSGELLCPPGCEVGWRLAENQPTSRQICGGFALSPLLGEALRIPTDAVYRVLKAIGTPELEPHAGSIVAFFDKASGPAETTVGHFALVESAPNVRVNLTSHQGTVILTKNMEERAYRGDLSEYVAGSLRSGVKAPAHRPNKWDYEFWKIDWGHTSARRVGGPFAIDNPILHPSTTALRVQVVDARTYALLDGARVELRFHGSSDALAMREVVPGGVADFRSVPGSSGRYRVVASAPDFAEGALSFRVTQGTPAHVIVPLAPTTREAAPSAPVTQEGGPGAGTYDVLVVVTDPRASPAVVYEGSEILVVLDGQTYEQVVEERRKQAREAYGANVRVEIRRQGSK